VTGDNIVGEAWLRIWPLSQWGTIQSYSLSDQLTASSLESQSDGFLVGVIACP